MGGSEPIWIGYPNDDQFCHFMNRTNLLISYNGNTWYTGQTEDPNPPTDLMDGVECEWDPLPYIIVPAQKQD